MHPSWVTTVLALSIALIFMILYLTADRQVTMQ